MKKIIGNSVGFGLGATISGSLGQTKIAGSLGKAGALYSSVAVPLHFMKKISKKGKY